MDFGGRDFGHALRHNAAHGLRHDRTGQAAKGSGHGSGDPRPARGEKRTGGGQAVETARLGRRTLDLEVVSLGVGVRGLEASAAGQEGLDGP